MDAKEILTLIFTFVTATLAIVWLALIVSSVLKQEHGASSMSKGRHVFLLALNCVLIVVYLLRVLFDTELTAIISLLNVAVWTATLVIMSISYGISIGRGIYPRKGFKMPAGKL